MISESERKKLLGRIKKDSSTIGTTLPQEMELQGRVVEVKRRVISDEDCSELKQALLKERSDLVEMIDETQISQEEGEEAASKIRSIDRALSMIPSDGSSVEELMAKKEAEDKRRWLNFVQKVSED